jgi:hypothetical protein
MVNGLSDYCDVVDGTQGCCEIGKVCTGTSDECDKAGYVPCTNDDFCCREFAFTFTSLASISAHHEPFNPSSVPGQTCCM